MTDLHESVTDYIQGQFEAFQLDDDGFAGPGAGSSRAASIKKHIQLAVLNHGIASMSLDAPSSRSSTGAATDEVARLVTPLLMRYVDAAVTMETNAETKDTIARVLDLVSALACAISSDAVDTILDRAQLFAGVQSERLRCQACDLLRCMTCHLRLVLVQMKRKNRPKDSNENLDTTWAVRQLEKVEEALVPRLTDKSQMVRQSAIQAIGVLLSVTNADLGLGSAENDDKTKGEATKFFKALDALLWTLRHDPSAGNRVEALLAVPVSTCKDTLDDVISRIRDVKEKVRVTALDVMRHKVDPREMKEEHFCEIIQLGLTERCEATKAATTKLICNKWFKAAKFDPVELLRQMDVTTNDEECEKALKTILATARSSDHSIIQDLSDPEIRSFCMNVDKSMIQLHDSNVLFDEYQLFFTRVACSTANDSKDLTFGQKEELMAKTTPDIPTLCDLFQKHLVRLIESIQEEDQESEDQEGFVCLQLLKLAKVSGLQEEGSRRHFAAVMTEVLSSTETPDDLVEESLQALHIAHDNEVDYFEAISTIVFNLSSSDEQSEGRGEDSDVETLRDLRVLLIFAVVLENAPSSLSSHELLDGMGKVILTSLTSSNRLVREVGISCVGRLGLFSQESTVLSEFMPVLLQVAENEEEALQCRGQALLALADWALLYSEILHQVQNTGDEGPVFNFVSIVQKIMAHENKSLAAIAAEVAAKLLFSGRLCDSQLLAGLLAMFFYPCRDNVADDEEDDIKQVGSPVRLQQLLSLFFPSFCLQSPESRLSLLRCVDSASQIGLNLGSSDTKTRTVQFPVVKMAEYVCAVVAESEVAMNAMTSDGDPSQNKARSINVELSVCLQIAQFLVKNESKLCKAQLRSVCKLLGGYEIDVGDKSNIDLGKLKDRLDEIESFLTDDTALRSLEHLIDSFADVKGADESEVDDQESTSDDDVMSDDETLSESSFDGNNNGTEIVGDESTVDDCLMDSLAKLSFNKENPSRLSTASTNKSRNVRTSSKRSLESGSSAGALESLGRTNS